MADDVVLMRDVEALRDLSSANGRQEFIGRHFVDAPGEEDASKARPLKAVEVKAYVRWLLSKGLEAAPQTPGGPESLLRAGRSAQDRASRGASG